ncbi:MAG: hypothetical protein ABUS51_04425 [Acidobacteriota bacterium]
MPYSPKTAVWLVAISMLRAAAPEPRPPAENRYAQIAAAGSILPGGRVVQPYGTQLETGPGPFGLALSPRGVVATADIGFERFGVTRIERVKTSWSVGHWWARTPHSKLPEIADPDWNGVSFGIAFDSERSVWISEGNSGRLRLLDTRSGNHEKIVDLNQGEWRNSFTGDLAFDPVKRLLYVLDQANFRMVVVDAKKGQVLASVAVGRLPFAITLSPEGGTAYVTNVGVFQYAPLKASGPNGSAAPGLSFPAFGFPSPESRDGVRRHADAAPVDVPGLGDPNLREANSVCLIDVNIPAKPVIVKWIRTGNPFGGAILGGSAPSGVLAAGDRVYVSNAHDDSITVLSASERNITGEIPLRVQGLEGLRGIMPAGMAFDPLTKWLLVAEAGLNAVGVIDTGTNQLIGHIPAGWLPTRVAIAGDRVYVTNTKGRGTGPRLRHPLMEWGETPTLHRGTVSTFLVPPASELPNLSRTVYAANGMLPNRGAVLPDNVPAVPDAIRHVVLIVRESASFDEMLGDVGLRDAGENGNRRVQAVPQLARFGLHGMADGQRKQFSIKDAAITPNLHAMATQWAFSDNFYADSEDSPDGHQWLAGVHPDLLTISGILAAYGGQRQFVADGHAPGRLLFGAAGSPISPEEQPEAGTLWHHLERHGITFRNFGAGPNREGTRVLTNVPMPEPLFRNTSRDYPGFDTNIPDQYRADRFIAEMEERYGRGTELLPRFLFIHLPNDRAAAEREDDRYPYQASFVSDNDLALGRILQYLSHKPWWRQMAVFVTDAGAQGLDHIDSHRTVLLAAGPWIRRNYVSHTNSDFPGLIKTIFQLLGLPPLNLMDATAASLRDMFTTEPDYAAYDALPPDPRIFDPARSRKK